MTEKTKIKNALPAGAPERRRRKLTRTTLLSALLLASFVVAFGYAALAVYQWAHTTALEMPGVRQVSQPGVALPAAVQPQASDIVPSLGLQPKLPQATNPDQPPAAQQADASQRITFLLLGVDQRPDDPSPLRTDTMIVVTVQPETNQVGMISLPRDLFVPIPDFDTSGKITTAFTVWAIPSTTT